MIKKDNRGLTLIELLVALVITLIAIPLIYNIFISSAKSYSIQEDVTDMQQNARASLEFMAREMRNLDTINTIDCTTDNSNITFTSVEDNGTATGSTSNTLTDTTKSWSSNEWQDYTVAIVAGTGNGQTAVISSNTSSQLTLSSNWTTNPDNTSFYRIRGTKRFTMDVPNNLLHYARAPKVSQLVNEAFTDEITKLTLTTNPSGCSPADISRIDIELEARTEAKDPNMGNQYHTYTVKSSVKLRN